MSIVTRRLKVDNDGRASFWGRGVVVQSFHNAIWSSGPYRRVCLGRLARRGSRGLVGMICVTIGRGRHSSLAEEWKEAAEAGVELVELRIDCLRREAGLEADLQASPDAVVFTIRRGVDGGLWRGNEDKRQQLLREAIAMGVDYVDLEMDIATKIRRFGKTKRIISYHNLKTTPVDLQDIADKCEEFDPDVVKIATSASTLAEASRVLHLATTAKGPDDPDRHG